MTLIRTDPLLLGAKIVVGIGIGLCIFATVMVGIGFGALLTVGRGEVLAKLTEAGAPGSAYPMGLLALALVFVILALAVKFLLTLFAIIRSVDRGNPFEPENGSRLALMGWIAIAAQVTGVIVGAIVAWLAPFAEKAGGSVDLDFDPGGGGLLLILVLFILARVFRKGAEMREELEGTV